MTLLIPSALKTQQLLSSGMDIYVDSLLSRCDILPMAASNASFNRSSCPGSCYCPVCERALLDFKSFAESLSEIYRSLVVHKFDLRLFENAEMCNMANYTCSMCGANDRDRICALYLKEIRRSLSPGTRLTLLDFAPSIQLQRKIHSLGCFEYRSADLTRDDVDDRVDIRNMSIYNDNTFDCFICSHVLEHVDDDLRAMRELWRILKPGGWGIALVPIPIGLKLPRESTGPTTMAERMRYFGQGDHVRLYSKGAFLNRLTHAGFRVSELGGNYFGTRILERHAITPTSVLYVCHKASC